MSAPSPGLVVFPDRTALAHSAARRFVAIAQDAIRTRGKFSAALSGGSTPRDLFTFLATHEFSSQVDWSRAHLFWSDERSVPPDHPDSNFQMARTALISHVPIPAENVHRIRAEIAPEDAAREYEETLREFFTPSPAEPGRDANTHRPDEDPSRSKDPHGMTRGGVGAFDLILLGLGPDAHTASLFPHTPALRETSRWVTAQYIEKLMTHRITFTPLLINAAINILFLVAGADKADAVHAVLRGTYSPEDFPAQLIQPTRGSVMWLLDQAASRKLKA